MKQQKIVASVALAVCLISFSAMYAMPIWAENGVTPTVTPRGQKRETLAKTNADKEIDRRVTVLNKLITKLGVLKRVNDAQRSSLTAQVQAEISNLTALKVKIDADTDLATLKADKKSIVDSYRVFSMFVPSVTITAHADQILNTGASLQTIAGKLQVRIDTAKTAGKDVTTASAKLSDMNAKIADAVTSANNAVTTVASSLTDARKMLMTARTDLRTARQDAVAVRRAL